MIWYHNMGILQYAGLTRVHAKFRANVPGTGDRLFRLAEIHSPVPGTFALNLGYTRRPLALVQ